MIAYLDQVLGFFFLISRYWLDIGATGLKRHLEVGLYGHVNLFTSTYINVPRLPGKADWQYRQSLTTEFPIYFQI